VLGRTVIRTHKLWEFTYPFSAAATVTARGRDFLRLPSGASLVFGGLAGRLEDERLTLVVIKLGDSVDLLRPVSWLLRLLWRAHLW
jgi:hypothetical protein